MLHQRVAVEIARGIYFLWDGSACTTESFLERAFSNGDKLAQNVANTAMLWNPDNPGTANQSNQMRQAAPALGLDLIALSGHQIRHERPKRRSHLELVVIGFGSVTEMPSLSSA
jgi:hypothetical protein